MAGCAQTLSGLQLGCLNSTGGVKNIWICSYADFGTYVINSEDTMITSLTMTGQKKFYKYDVVAQTASMNATKTMDPINGVAYVATELTISFKKMGAENRKELSELTKAPVVCIVEDNNKMKWVCGIDGAMTATAGTGNTGTAMTDANEFSVTLTDNSPEYAYPLDEAFDMSAIVDRMK